MTKTVKLGDICDINPPKKSNLDDNMPISFLAMADVSEEGKILNSQVRSVSEVKKGFTPFSENDVLIAKITPCFENGKGVLLNDLVNGVGFGSTEFHVIRPKSDASPKYIFYATRGKSFKEQGKQNMTGSAGQQRVPSSFIRDYKIPLPPLPRQRQIAALLDRADALRQKDRQLLALYDKLAQSTFLDLFGDPTTNEKGWDIMQLGNLISQFKYGTNKKSDSENRLGKYPVIRIPNVLDNQVNLDDLKFSELSLQEWKDTKLSKGDLLFVRTNGNPAYIGRCAVFKKTEECSYASYLIRAKPYHEILNSDFAQFVISYQSYRPIVLRKATTTAGNYNINTEALKSLPVPVPPLALQQRFAAIIERIEAQKAVVRQQMAASEALFQRLLQDSFGA